MDDVLSGPSSLHEAQQLRIQLSQLCMAGGFPLRRWTANNDGLLQGVPPENRHQQFVTSLAEHDILGFRWDPVEDSFAPAVRSAPDRPITKRAVLAQTARLFDPLGWLAPVVVRAKLLIQRAWLQRLDWDEPLASEEAALWKQLQVELPKLEDIRIPRWIRTDLPDCAPEIHGFADASERAYGAVVYLRTISCKGTCLSLLLAKTRVAPLKQVSLPRLELCAAALLSRLVVHTTGTLSLPAAPAHLWTDSTVALGWIHGHPTRWTTFVANRVAEIQQLLPNACWHHVRSRDNPADCASRGASPRGLGNHALWWRGPEFLWASTAAWPSTFWTTAASILPEGLPEWRPVRIHLMTASPEEPKELTRFSSWHRLLRVTAWILRW